MMGITKRRPLFERLKRALEEGASHVRGELSLRVVAIPDEPPQVDGPTLAALRLRAGMSQAVLARVLNVSTKTLQSWEQGSRRPSEVARRLIQVFREEPETLCRIAGMAPIQPRGKVGQINAAARRVADTIGKRRKAI